MSSEINVWGVAGPLTVMHGMASQFVVGHPSSPRNMVLYEKVTINFDDMTVVFAPGVTVDEAAKMFWNGVAQVVGQPPMFPEVGDA